MEKRLKTIMMDGNILFKKKEEGYVLAGTHFSDTTVNEQVFLMMFNSEGDSIWTKYYPIKDISTRSFSMCLTSDGGFAVSGSIFDYLEGQEYIDGDMLLLKTDSLGNFEYYKRFGGEGTDGGGRILQTEDGGFLCGGTTLSFNEGSSWPQDWYVVKTDSLGNLEWQNHYGNPSLADGTVNDIVALGNNEYLIGGLYKLALLTGKTIKEARIIKVNANSNGSVLWDKRYKEYYYDEDMFVDTVWSEVSAITVKNSHIYSIIKNHINSVTEHSKFYKIDLNGDTVFTKQYRVTTDTLIRYELLKVIKPTPDGGFIMGGYIEDSYWMDPYQQIWLVKTDSLGNDNGIFTISLQKTDIHIHLYPNPVKDNLTIKLVTDNSGSLSPDKGKINAAIIDLQGKEIMSLPAFTHFNNQQTINISHLKSGWYSVVIETEKGNRTSRAFVKE
jgi:hypothetical protein